MLYNASHRDELKAWLIKSLEPICDAEPDALAAYVLALLSHDAPEQELRKEIIKQLEEFLEGGSDSFVDSLFASLRSKSYIPYSTSAPTSAASYPKSADTGIPIPLDALITPPLPNTSPGRGQKRSLDDDDREYRGPPKGPRLNGESGFSRHPQQQQQENGQHPSLENGSVWQSGREGYGSANGAVAARGAGSGPRWVPNGYCRDYHLKGYCGRGQACKYMHEDPSFAPGPIPFNPAMGMPGGPMPFLPIMPFPLPAPMNPSMNPVQSPTYDPNEAHMDMRRGPVQFGQNNGDGQTFAPASQSGQDFSAQRPQKKSSMVASNAMEQDAQGSMPSEPGMSNGSSFYPNQPHGGNQSFRGRGRGGGHGTFSADNQRFRGEGSKPSDNKTIVVEKIPEDHLSLEAVNGWFKRFGTVTNVAVDSSGAKALVSFSTHDEARAAWKSEDAVFNNRFVKVFWHRPMEGQGSFGTKALQASAPLVANLTARQDSAVAPVTSTVRPSHATPTPQPVTKAGPSSSALSALAAKQQLLEKLIAEQKELIGKLGSAQPQEKKEIMGRLRKLDAEMTAAKSVSSTVVPSTPVRTTPTPNGDKERKAKELLDMELDMHSKVTDGREEKSSVAAETTESLQEKLARLRAEASALGISDAPASPYPPSYRGYRGRGRGRASFRGSTRGGPPRASMKLDNRTRSLLVKGIKTQEPEAVQAVRGWYELGGQVSTFDVHDDDSVIIAFQSRAAAEQALAKGGSLPPPVGTVKLSWHNVVSPAVAKDIAAPSSSIADKKPTLPVNEDRPASPRPDEVLPDDSGWGDGDEDGMGMF